MLRAVWICLRRMDRGSWKVRPEKEGDGSGNERRCTMVMLQQNYSPVAREAPYLDSVASKVKQETHRLWPTWRTFVGRFATILQFSAQPTVHCIQSSFYVNLCCFFSSETRRDFKAVGTFKDFPNRNRIVAGCW
jgi:hypothetical protein